MAGYVLGEGSVWRYQELLHVFTAVPKELLSAKCCQRMVCTLHHLIIFFSCWSLMAVNLLSLLVLLLLFAPGVHADWSRQLW